MSEPQRLSMTNSKNYALIRNKKFIMSPLNDLHFLTSIKGTHQLFTKMNSHRVLSVFMHKHDRSEIQFFFY